MPFTSTFVGVPDDLVVKVQSAISRLRDAGDQPDTLPEATAEAVKALEATRSHVRPENQALLDHFIEMVTNPERSWTSGH
jgi:hypothetical protein